ncbi:MAG: hypothetical protein PF440_05080, partial [Thiomicrorhabdus sp.]|nr:hypothetical protein [Thiomicrorhabdus sp.]
LTFVINDLDDAVGYYYGVTASNAAGFESELSNIVYSPAFAPPEPPKALGGTTTVNNVDIPM